MNQRTYKWQKNNLSIVFLIMSLKISKNYKDEKLHYKIILTTIEQFIMVFLGYLL